MTHVAVHKLIVVVHHSNICIIYYDTKERNPKNGPPPQGKTTKRIGEFFSLSNHTKMFAQYRQALSSEM